MLDKILGKKKENEKYSPPDLRGKKKDDPDLGDQLKNLAGKATRRVTKEDKEEKTPSKRKPKTSRRIPKPLPKPKEKSGIKPRLGVPPKKPDSKKPKTFGRMVPTEDRRNLVGAAVFGLILIIIVGAGYYLLIYQPYQESLQNVKNEKLNEVQSYFKEPLTTDPRKQSLLTDINAANTPEEAHAVDVLGPATLAWRQYQSQQISIKKDPYNWVELTYAADQKNVIIKVADAERLVNQSDAGVLANLTIKTPDNNNVIIPIPITHAYGWRLSDFERASDLGKLNIKYFVLLEVPRENATWISPATTSY